MSDPPPSPPFRSLARRQAILTAAAAFLASVLVGVAVLKVSSADLQARIEGKFVDLANEREKQIELVVSRQYAVAQQTASRTRLRSLLPRLKEQDEEAIAEANEILKDAARATTEVFQTDVLDVDGRVIASTSADRLSAGPFPDLVTPVTLRRPIAEPPIGSPFGVVTRVTVPLYAAGVKPTAGGGQRPPADAVVVMVTDAQPMMNVLQDTRPLGLGGTLLIQPADSQVLQTISGMDDPPDRALIAADTAIGETLFYWQPVQFNPQTAEQWRIIASQASVEAYAPLRRLRWTLVGVGGLIAVVVTAASYLAARRLSRRLDNLTEAAQRAATAGLSGFDMPLIGGTDEVGKLAGAFTAMGERVGVDLREARDEAERERAARARLTAELELAREVQSRLYPADSLRLPGVEVTGRSMPAEQLCGDYFDYFASPAGLVFAVGDVSGHGVGPSLMMVEVRSVLRGLRRQPDPLLETVQFLNDRLAEESPDGRFVSLLVGRLDTETGELEYVGAGHRGFVVRREGQIEEVESTGLILGLFAGAPLEAGRLTLQSRDILCVASDGIEETMNAAGKQFGWKAIATAAAAASGRPLEGVIEHILERSTEHSDGQPPTDDRTLLVLRRT